MGLRTAALAGVVASATLLADVVRPGRGFCPLKKGCTEASASPLGSLLGIPTAAVGVAAFLGLLALTLWGSRWARVVVRPAAILAAVCGATFLAYQALALDSFCPFCVIADLAGLAAGLMVVGGAATALDGAAMRRRLGWGFLASLVVAGPLLWPRAEPPAWTEVPEVATSEADLAPLRETSVVAVIDVESKGSPGLVAADPQAPDASVDSSPSPVSVPVAPVPPGPLADVEVVGSVEDTDAAEQDEVAPPAAPGEQQPTASVAPPPAESVVAEQPPSPPRIDSPSPSAPPASPGALFRAQTPPIAAPATPAREPAAGPRAPTARPAEQAPPPVPPEVTFVEFLNPFCAHCRATHGRIDQAVASAGIRVRRYRVYVWSSPKPPLWAKACACSAAMGKEDALFSELLKCDRDTPEAIWAAAQRIGLDVRALSAAVQRGDAAARLTAESRRVQASSIRALPTLDIGRRRLQGEQSEVELRAAIRAATEALMHPAPGQS